MKPKTVFFTVSLKFLFLENEVNQNVIEKTIAVINESITYNGYSTSLVFSSDVSLSCF